jgi:hypothetical protein
MDDVRKMDCRLHTGAEQVKLPTPPEKKLMSPGTGSIFFFFYTKTIQTHLLLFKEVHALMPYLKMVYLMQMRILL